MSDTLSKLPDDQLPLLCDLPGELARIAMILEEVAPGKGVRSALRLVDEYGGMPIYVPGMKPFKLKRRDEEIVKLYTDGVKVTELARINNLSVRQVWKILGRVILENRQLKLFER